MEFLKHGNKAAIELYDKLHDPRKLYLCERCHCTWKCVYSENKFGNSPGPNEGPDVLCPECGSNKVETNEAVIYAILSEWDKYKFTSGREE